MEKKIGKVGIGTAGEDLRGACRGEGGGGGNVWVGGGWGRNIRGVKGGGGNFGLEREDRVGKQRGNFGHWGRRKGVMLGRLVTKERAREGWSKKKRNQGKSEDGSKWKEKGGGVKNFSSAR